MSSKINYLYLQRRYGGKYVATYKGRVVASGNAGAVVKKILKDPRRPNLVIQFFPPYKAVCIYDISTLRKANRIR